MHKATNSSTYYFNIMFKNVKIKRFIKSTVTPIASKINNLIPKDDNIILLYSANHGIEHNLRPLKKYLLNNGYDKKYHIVCVVEDMSYAEDDGLEYVTQRKGVNYFLHARHVFYTTGQVPIKPSKNQIVIHMDHGTTAIKTGNLLTNIHNGDDFFFTYYCAPSKQYIDVIKREFNCKEGNIVINSEPVTDVFFQKTDKYDLGSYDKLGVWAPTFRQSDYLGYDDSTEEDLLPTLKPDDYEEFNNLLKQKNIKLIVKLHDMQDLNKYKNLNYSNLIIYSGRDFNNQGYDLYKLLKQSDFILADYSSVFLQYLLLDRPIGFVIPDIDEYREKRGFIFSDVEAYMPGPKIMSKQDLYNFVIDIANGKDGYETERKRVNNLVNAYQDGKSCDRLMTFSDLHL